MFAVRGFEPLFDSQSSTRYFVNTLVDRGFPRNLKWEGKFVPNTNERPA